MDLKNNLFDNNTAIYGGGGIYFKNKILRESPYKFNKFMRNTAFFANDFSTFPIKVRFQDDANYKSWVNKASYTMKLIPGISQINLNFSVVDYYGQTLKLNGYFSDPKIYLIFSFKYIFYAN